MIRFTNLSLKTLLLVVALFVVQMAMAQRERNYIYLLDCTKSMIGYNGSPDIWESTKGYLRTDIERQTAGTMVHVVPFQGSTLPAYNFLAQNFNWSPMEKELDNIVQNVTRTNICDAWDAAAMYIDKNKDNYIYLLTDGVDNVKGTSELAKRLESFCGKYRNTRAFYVVLTKNAIDTRIKEIVDNCPEEMFVDASKKLDPFGSFDEDVTIYANTLNLPKTHKVLFSAAGEFPASAVCDDPYFSVAIEGDKIRNGIVVVKISAMKSIQEINAAIPDVYEFTFDVNAKGVEVINPKIKVVMTNKPERELDILSEEENMGKAEWYDSFLFWGAKDQDTLHVDLKAVFNSEAKKDGSAASFKIVDVEGLNDFTLFFNGEELKDGILKTSAETMPQSTILSIVFDDHAKEGKRYLRITTIAKNKLERINGEPADDYEVTLRSEYSVSWNPLKTILMWLGIIIGAALLIWFLILKHIFFPTFKVGSVMITEPYYGTIRIKGKRKLIFANKRQEQSALNRLFTGEVLCNVNPCWSQPLVLEPAKKKIRAQRNKTYVFDPYGSQLNPHAEYVVENTDTNEKIKMTIN